VDVSGRNTSTSDVPNVDKPVTADRETRLPFTSSLASTLNADRSRTGSSASDAERQTADRSTDSVKTDSARQNGVDPSFSVTRGSDPVGIPSHSSTNGGGMPLQRASQVTSNDLSHQEAENFVAQWTGDTTQLVGGGLGTTHSDPPAAVAQTDDGWYYCDPQGQIQGETSLVDVA